MVVRDCNIYVEQLVELGHGYPLWEPGPSNGHRRISLGDVGYIQDGHFQFLFNARSANLINPRFVSLPAGTTGFDAYAGTSRGPMVLSSRSIHALDCGLTAGVDFIGADAKLEFEIKNNRDRGAAVATQYKTKIVNAIERNLFKTYIKAHFASWHAFFAARHDIQPNDLVLVTGYDITDDWAMCAFSSNRQDIELGAGVNVTGLPVASGFIRWVCRSNGRMMVRNGPDRDEDDDEPALSAPITAASDNGFTQNSAFESRSTPRNPTQCIFVRGYRMKTFLKYNIGIPTTTLRAAAGPHVLDERSRKDDDDVDPMLALCQDNDDGVEELGGKIECYDPYAAVFDYIRDNSNPPACQALVHDDDLGFVYELGKHLDDAVGVAGILKRVRPRIKVDESGVGYIDCEQSSQQAAARMPSFADRTDYSRVDELDPSNLNLSGSLSTLGSKGSLEIRQRQLPLIPPTPTAQAKYTTASTTSPGPARTPVNTVLSFKPRVFNSQNEVVSTLAGAQLSRAESVAQARQRSKVRLAGISGGIGRQFGIVQDGKVEKGHKYRETWLRSAIQDHPRPLPPLRGPARRSAPEWSTHGRPVDLISNSWKSLVDQHDNWSSAPPVSIAVSHLPTSSTSSDGSSMMDSCSSAPTARHAYPTVEEVGDIGNAELPTPPDSQQRSTIASSRRPNSSATLEPLRPPRTRTGQPLGPRRPRHSRVISAHLVPDVPSTASDSNSPTSRSSLQIQPTAPAGLSGTDEQTSPLADILGGLQTFEDVRMPPNTPSQATAVSVPSEELQTLERIVDQLYAAQKVIRAQVMELEEARRQAIEATRQLEEARKLAYEATLELNGVLQQVSDMRRELDEARRQTPGEPEKTPEPTSARSRRTSGARMSRRHSSRSWERHTRRRSTGSVSVPVFPGGAPVASEDFVPPVPPVPDL